MKPASKKTAWTRLPLRLPYLPPLSVSLVLVSVYYWAVHRPSALPAPAVFFLGLMADLLGQLRAAFADPAWATPVTLFTGFAFAGMIYFLVSFAMSRYALAMERRLSTEHRR